MSPVIDFEPIGKRFEFSGEMTVYEAAKEAGVGINSICGGKGTCGKCRIKVDGPVLNPLTDQEKKLLSRAEIEDGYRLACQAIVGRDVEVYLPISSISSAQKLGVTGQEKEIEVDPVVRKYVVSVEPATLTDVRSDLLRIKDALRASYGVGPSLKVDWLMLRGLPEKLRASNWRIGVVVRGDEIIDFTSDVEDGGVYGLAVDVGTTKVAVFLVDLVTGKTVESHGFMNPQIMFGEDVMSRLHFAMESPGGLNRLRRELIKTLNSEIEKICRAKGVEPQSIYEVVCVGNTAMHHLFLGYPVRQLALSPFVPVASEPIEVKAKDLGINVASGAYVYWAPVVAGFVGADHVAMILASRMTEQPGTVMGIDIGTNTEIALKKGDRLASTSAASGPAFEGAHIKYGMRATSGAIERVVIDPKTYKVRYFTVDDKPPIGICGSGVLDVVAQLISAGIVDKRGKLSPNIPGVRKGEDGVTEFVLASKDSSRIPEDVVFTQRDMVAIQLAKGAIRTGIDVLCERLDVEPQAIDKVIIAGAFGLYIDPKSAITIGMFPELPLNRFEQVGNAAGVGAKELLVSATKRRVAVEVAKRIEYVELTVADDFEGHFASSLLF